MSDIIPFVDLKTQFVAYKDKFEKVMESVCLSTAYILGPEVSQFEKRFAEYIGVEEAIGVGSGTDALRLACRALDIGAGDEVLIPANTFIATALAVYDLGGIVVPVDVNPETYLIDLTDARKKVTKKTKAIIPVHLYGQAADMDQISAFADKNSLTIIEDACQSHGAFWKGKCTGSIGAAGCFSFYPAKNLGAFGDGGMITTNNQGLARKLRMLRNYGSEEKYIHEMPGTNSRLDSLQAAVLNVKIEFLEAWNARRFAAACWYTDALNGIPDILPPAFDQGKPSSHVFHLFVIQCDRRDELLAHLNKLGIQCGIHYPKPIHLHRAFASLKLGLGAMPVSESLAGRILSLPMFPEITEDQVNRVTVAVRAFYGK